MERLSTDSYKGVRDFYPEDAFIQDYLFEAMRSAAEKFGYERYDASILEPAELYRSKTSDEIVGEQTYTFTDRGEREVTLRPEMTPTVARMIAARRKSLTFPVRWYSIPNCFRYERAQRGRLREFWQLNADLVGASGPEADAEIIALAHATMIELGASEHDFEIRINDRRILNDILDHADVQGDDRKAVMGLLDRKNKIDDFDARLFELLGDGRGAQVIEGLSHASSSTHLEELRSMLFTLGISNTTVDTSIVRGFDYYTGMVFEVYDTAPENRRAVAGGGRYDNLLTLFGNDTLPAVGFAMGDVTARDFLESHDLLPTYRPATEVMLCVMDQQSLMHAMKLAQDLRTKDVTVALNFSGKKIGDQIRQADHQKIPFIIAVGEKERDSGMYTLKHLATGNERTMPADHIPDHLFSAMG